MGGSSGGGGSSGAVDYPAYMKTRHETWLSEIATDITIAQSANPYSTAVAYDPDCVLAASNFVISQFYDLVVAIDPDADWVADYDTAVAKFDEQTITAITEHTFTDLTFDEQTPTTISDHTFDIGLSFDEQTNTAITSYSFDSLLAFDEKTITAILGHSFSNIFDSAHVTALISSFQADLESRRDNDFKPAYKVGMQNVNAVMSSAFTIGDALITAQVARDVANFSAELNFKNEEKLLQYEQVQAQENTEHNRNIIARNQLEVSQETARLQAESSLEQIKSQENTAHNGNIIQQDQLDFNQAASKGQFDLNLEQAKAQENTDHNRNLLLQDQTAVTQATAKGQFELSYDQMQAEENTAHNRNILARDQLIVQQADAKGQFGLNGVQAISSLLSTQLQFGVAISNLTTDANRIKIVSKQEENDKNLKYDRQDAVWDLEMYQYGSNVMASIAGTALKQESEVSTGASVLGGALTGAAVGAAIGPVGALSGGAVAGIGAAIGGLGGLF